MARIPSMTSPVRGGPKIRNDFGAGLITHWVVTTSLRSQM